MTASSPETMALGAAQEPTTSHSQLVLLGNQRVALVRVLVNTLMGKQGEEKQQGSVRWARGNAHTGRLPLMRQAQAALYISWDP